MTDDEWNRYRSAQPELAKMEALSQYAKNLEDGPYQFYAYKYNAAVCIIYVAATQVAERLQEKLPGITADDIRKWCEYEIGCRL